MKISARNTLKGRVKEVKQGAVNDEVTLELPGNMDIVATITRQSAERLDLKPGREAYAVIKASNVMVMVE